MTGVNCDRFAEEAEDLALGHASEPQRAELLAHASSCARCGSLLRDLSATVDRLLELAPEAEPPVGFETRAVAGMAPRRRWPAARLRLVAAACVAVGVVAGIGITRVVDRPTPDAAVAARIVAADGAPLGRVELYRPPQARVVVVLDRSRTWRGAWSCELQRDDGTWVTVGTWTADETPSSSWTSPITADLAHAPAMRIRAENGDVIATATMD